MDSKIKLVLAYWKNTVLLDKIVQVLAAIYIVAVVLTCRYLNVGNFSAACAYAPFWTLLLLLLLVHYLHAVTN